MGADADIAAVGRGYIQVVLCFAPCFMLNYTFTAFTRNDNAPKTAMAATLISGVFNIIFDYIFMFPMQMGMVGAALATGNFTDCQHGGVRRALCTGQKRPSARAPASVVAKAVCGMQFGCGCLCRRNFQRHYHAGIQFYLAGLRWQHCRCGLRRGCQHCTGGNLAAQRRFPRITAFGKCSTQYAQRKRKAAHSSSGLQIAGAIAVAMTALVFLFAPQLVAVFNTEQSQTLADYAQTGLRLYFLGFLIAFINMVCSGFFSATEKGRRPRRLLFPEAWRRLWRWPLCSLACGEFRVCGSHF